MRDYIAFDIENPNAKGNSICSMGIVIVKDNKVVDKKYYLVNPEDRFDIRNKEITGITESMTFDKPTLQEIWPEIERLFLENVIVGHNITYDLAVLSKSLLRYNIVPPDFKYCCTLRLSRSNMEAKSYKLSSLMEMLEYEYDAHNALADALAAQYLFEIICKSSTATPLSYHYEKVVKETMDEKLSKNINSLNGIINGIIADDAVNDKEIQRLKKWVEENRCNTGYKIFYRLVNQLDEILCDDFVSPSEFEVLKNIISKKDTSKIYTETTLALQVLYGILDGLACDERINEKEVWRLEEWIDKNDFLSDVYPYDKVHSLIKRVIADGIIDETEKNEIYTSFNDILNPGDEVEDDIEFGNKTFCLTGEFVNGSRTEVASRISALGGIEKKSVSGKVDYLFVGDLGSNDWKCGQAGGKILKAQELQEKGSGIRIIKEDKLFKYL